MVMSSQILEILSVMAKSPFFLLIIAFLILVCGLFLIFNRWVAVSAKSSKSAWGTLFQEYKPLFAGFFVITISSIFVWLAYNAALQNQTPNLTSTQSAGSGFLGAFLASLVEDIAFFAALGFLIVAIQRREYNLHRKIGDRIDSLFNRKPLTNDEIGYLKDQISENACDFIWNETFIDIVSYNHEHSAIKLDVARRFHIGNYLTDLNALYKWRIRLQPDEISPLTDEEPFEFYPFFRGWKENSNGSTKPPILSEVIADGSIVAKGHVWDKTLVETAIEPGEVCEFRMRYRGWQPLTHLPDSSEPYPYELESQRHWDTMEVTVRNSLAKPVNIVIKGPKGPRSVTIGSGDHLREAFHAKDLPTRSEVHVMFTIN